jgi:hypothetical protein
MIGKRKRRNKGKSWMVIIFKLNERKFLSKKKGNKQVINTEN